MVSLFSFMAHILDIVGYFLLALRPKQWLKNALVFIPLAFSGSFHSGEKIGESLLAFVLLCGLSSATYLYNDIRDRHDDRKHPKKSLRPIAAGKLSPIIAGFGACLLGAGMIFLATNVFEVLIGSIF